MRSIYKKLRDRRGTSLLMALVFFLICLTAGTLTLTAATAAGAKSADRGAQTQAYLAVSSAARLLRSELGNYTYTTGEELVTETIYDDAGQAVGERSHWEEIAPYVTPLDAMEGDLLTDLFRSTGGTQSAQCSFSVSAGKGLAPVQVRGKMTAGGDATLWLQDAAGTCAMQIAFAAATTVDTDAENRDDATYRYETVAWSRGKVTKGAV